MIKRFSIVLFLLFAGALVCRASEDDLDGCTKNGKLLAGKVKIVESFADFKVEIVESFPDLKVKLVNSFADDCGEWEIVESFPDFTVQFVESFPDFKIKFVESFPGVA